MGPNIYDAISEDAVVKNTQTIAKISGNLIENEDKTMTPTFVIRDILSKWLDENQ